MRRLTAPRRQAVAASSYFRRDAVRASLTIPERLTTWIRINGPKYGRRWSTLSRGFDPLLTGRFLDQIR